MGGLLLKLQNFKNVKLIFGHPVFKKFCFLKHKTLTEDKDLREM